MTKWQHFCCHNCSPIVQIIYIGCNKNKWKFKHFNLLLISFLYNCGYIFFTIQYLSAWPNKRIRIFYFFHLLIMVERRVHVLQLLMLKNHYAHAIWYSSHCCTSSLWRMESTLLKKSIHFITVSLMVNGRKN